MAPEAIDGNYVYGCDIWSTACVLYMLLVGKLPFTGNNRNEVFEKIKSGRFAPAASLSSD